jgi:hypothetical protein
MSSLVSFYALNSAAYELIKGNGYLFHLLNGDAEEFEDATGLSANEVNIVGGSIERLQIGDWALGTASDMVAYFESISPELGSAIEQLEYLYGRDNIEVLDFGYSPANIFSPDQINEIYSKLDSIEVGFITKNDSKAEILERWLLELKREIKKVKDAGGYILITVC